MLAKIAALKVDPSTRARPLLAWFEVKEAFCVIERAGMKPAWKNVLRIALHAGNTCSLSHDEIKNAFYSVAKRYDIPIVEDETI